MSRYKTEQQARLRLGDIHSKYPHRVLKWTTKHDDVMWLADTPERAQAALKEMFKQCDDDGCYCDLGDDSDAKKEIAKLRDIIEVYKKHKEEDAVKEKQIQLSKYEHELEETAEEAKLYSSAKEGNIEAIYSLLSHRKDYEYEGWNFIVILDPLYVKE